MVQVVGILFIIFAVVGLFICGVALVGHASASGFFPTVDPHFGGPGSPSALNAAGGNSGGLSSIDFSLFAKNGKGWSYITQGYGETAYSYLYINHWHNGVDIAAQYGAPIYSPVENGVVLATGNQDNYCPGKGFGEFVAVEDNTNNVVLWFAHLGSIDVSAGQTISKGTELGSIGTTGLETGTHLHFSVFKEAGFSIKNKNGCGPDADGQDVNPMNYLGTVYH